MLHVHSHRTVPPQRNIIQWPPEKQMGPLQDILHSTLTSLGRKEGKIQGCSIRSSCPSYLCARPVKPCTHRHRWSSHPESKSRRVSNFRLLECGIDPKPLLCFILENKSLLLIPRMYGFLKIISHQSSKPGRLCNHLLLSYPDLFVSFINSYRVLTICPTLCQVLCGR